MQPDVSASAVHGGGMMLLLWAGTHWRQVSPSAEGPGYRKADLPQMSGMGRKRTLAGEGPLRRGSGHRPAEQRSGSSVASIR
jgi:hypothetical protein